MNNETLLKNLRNVPDFPIPGIQFKDVSTLFKNPKCMEIMVNELYELYKDKGITKVVGIESRGFVVGAALALKLGAGFVMCRKPGKLPAETRRESYMKEYGKDTIEIHSDAIEETDVVLLHDDLLATGGSMKAAYNLVKQFNPKKIYINFIIELTIEGLNGRSVFDKEVENETAFLQLCPQADDIWFYAHGLRLGLKKIMVPNSKVRYIQTDLIRQVIRKDRLHDTNFGEGQNNIQLNNLLNHYNIKLEQL